MIIKKCFEKFTEFKVGRSTSEDVSFWNFSQKKYRIKRFINDCQLIVRSSWKYFALKFSLARFWETVSKSDDFEERIN